MADAKARLSEVLRLSEEEGPQCSGIRRSFVVVPERLWMRHSPPRKRLGQWLVENVPRGVNLWIPRDRGADRRIPFIDYDQE